MTQKEKADDLYRKFYIEYDLHFTEWNEEYAKKHALTCVDELIKYLPSSNGNPPNLQEHAGNSEWWIKVKEEIQNRNGKL